MSEFKFSSYRYESTFQRAFQIEAALIDMDLLDRLTKGNVFVRSEDVRSAITILRAQQLVDDILIADASSGEFENYIKEKAVKVLAHEIAGRVGFVAIDRTDKQIIAEQEQIIKEKELEIRQLRSLIKELASNVE